MMIAAPIRRRSLLSGLSLLPLAAACSVLPSPQMPQIYRLSPHVDDPPGPRIPNSALAIDLPFASQSLDTDRIALTRGRTRFDYYADSVWTDRLPVLVQTVMVEAFETDGRLTEVNRDPFTLTRGYVLRTEIRRFQAEYPSEPDGSPNIAITLQLDLSTQPEGRLVASRLISANERASQNKLDAIITTFNSATADALQQMVVWTLQSISADRSRHIRS